MAITEKIQRVVEKLPTSFQAEALDFVQYLLAKAEHEMGREEERAWSALSLAFAMRGMEDENAPAYTASDLKVVFS